MTNNRIEKAWGYELILANTEKYCGKILHINKGWKCSLHYHKIKDETFYVLSGEVIIEHEHERKVMLPGNSVRILPEELHRFTGIKDSDIIEISTHHFDEDSYRIEKSQRVL